MQSRQQCVFFKPSLAEKAWHCGLYQGRSLLCRAFGFTGSYDKSGHVRYQMCRSMSFHGQRSFDHQAISEYFTGPPPVITDFTMQIFHLMPEARPILRPLHEWLPVSLQKIAALLDHHPHKPHSPVAPHAA